MEVVSTNATDSAAGSGVRTIRVTYIDSTNNLVQSAPIAMNGTTPVALGFTANQILWFEAITVGSATESVGIITLRRVVGPVTVCVIRLQSTMSFDAMFMCPVGYKAYLREWEGSCIANEQDLRMLVTANVFDGSINSGVYKEIDNMWLPSNQRNIHSLKDYRLDALCKAKIATISSSTAAATRVQAGFKVLLIQD